MISSGSRVIGFGISSLYWDNAYERFGVYNRKGQDVTIISNFLSDIYIVTLWDPQLDANLYNHPLLGFTAVMLHVKIIPNINILWAGCILLHFAIIPLIIGRYISLKKVFSIQDEQEDIKDENEGVEVTKKNGDVNNG